jgi:mannose/cellobiose epimerase-like protein (N-acyl-D-glucosamine 2-epimerase family)
MADNKSNIEAVDIKSNTVVNLDTDKLIAESTEPQVWYNHLENDLMKFWGSNDAKKISGGLFNTYRANNGQVFDRDDSADYPPEIKAALANPDLAGLIDLGYNYIRSHSRQTYAYGIAFNLTGKEEYLRLCKKGADALADSIDGNFGMFTKRDAKTGAGAPDNLQRISQDMAYGLTGLAMYYYLTHDETVLHRIVQVKKYIFSTYFDENNGYLTWYPKKQNDGDVEIVSQLDQIYAYMHFCVYALPEPYKSEWKEDLRKLVNVIINRFYSERYGFFWGVDSSSSTQQLGADHTDFGHSVKTFWLIYRIGLLVDEPAFVTFSRSKIDKILGEAYLEDTKSWGRRFTPDNKVETNKECWILAELDQAAALLALNDPFYLTYINNTYKYWFEYMVDKTNGEIWHRVDGETNKPVIDYPKIHSWKTSLHSFEHALFGFITSSQIKGKNFSLYYAFPEEKFSKSRIRPYSFEANIVAKDIIGQIVFDNGEGRTPDVLKTTKVTFNGVR